MWLFSFYFSTSSLVSINWIFFHNVFFCKDCLSVDKAFGLQIIKGEVVIGNVWRESWVRGCLIKRYCKLRWVARMKHRVRGLGSGHCKWQYIIKTVTTDTNLRSFSNVTDCIRCNCYSRGYELLYNIFQKSTSGEHCLEDCKDENLPSQNIFQGAKMIQNSKLQGCPSINPNT